MNRTERELYRGNWARLTDEIDPTHMITFNAGCAMRPHILASKVEKFCKMLEREAFGRNWYKRTEDRLLLIGFVEHPKSNIHCHAVARLRKSLRNALLAKGEDLWKEIAPRGQLHFSRIKDLARVQSYVTKELYLPDRNENIIVYVGSRGAFLRPLEKL